MGQRGKLVSGDGAIVKEFQQWGAVAHQIAEHSQYIKLLNCENEIERNESVMKDFN